MNLILPQKTFNRRSRNVLLQLAHKAPLLGHLLKLAPQRLKQV